MPPNPLLLYIIADVKRTRHGAWISWAGINECTSLPRAAKTRQWTVPHFMRILSGLGTEDFCLGMFTFKFFTTYEAAHVVFSQIIIQQPEGVNARPVRIQDLLIRALRDPEIDDDLDPECDCECTCECDCEDEECEEDCDKEEDCDCFDDCCCFDDDELPQRNLSYRPWHVLNWSHRHAR